MYVCVVEACKVFLLGESVCASGNVLIDLSKIVRNLNGELLLQRFLVSTPSELQKTSKSIMAGQLGV